MTLRFKIHRGASEIGGSCVELWTDNTRVVVDLGMPLVNPDKTPFDARGIADKGAEELISRGILPDIEGIYDGADNTALILSHAHQDHYGLVRNIHASCPVYLGEPTHKLIQLTHTFTGQPSADLNACYFKSGQPFGFGDIEVTPYLMDHAAFDAHAFLIKSNGKSLFYSGDFRFHGRKSKIFEWLTDHVEPHVDYLLLEGTTIGRDDHSFPTETDLEEGFVNQFRSNRGIHLVYVSGQNIDRLVSIYRACKRAGKICLVDVYVATVLREMAKFNQIPFPSTRYPEIKVFYPYGLSRMIAKKGKRDILYRFTAHKMTKEEIDQAAGDVVMTVRPSMRSDLEFLNCLQGGAFIYSMWSGYRKDNATSDFINFMTSRGMTDISIHTSGHADGGGLKKLVGLLKPKHLVPIHTFEADRYSSIFKGSTVKRVEDGVAVEVEGSDTGSFGPV